MLVANGSSIGFRLVFLLDERCCDGESVWILVMVILLIFDLICGFPIYHILWYFVQLYTRLTSTWWLTWSIIQSLIEIIAFSLIYFLTLWLQQSPYLLLPPLRLRTHWYGTMWRMGSTVFAQTIDFWWPFLWIMVPLLLLLHLDGIVFGLFRFYLNSNSLSGDVYIMLYRLCLIWFVTVVAILLLVLFVTQPLRH